MTPAVMLAVPTVPIMSWPATINSGATVESSTEASGVASCHISFTAIEVAFATWAIRPAVFFCCSDF